MKSFIQISSLRNFISNTTQTPFDANHHQLMVYQKLTLQPHRYQI